MHFNGAFQLQTNPTSGVVSVVVRENVGVGQGWGGWGGGDQSRGAVSDPWMGTRQQGKVPN